MDINDHERRHPEGSGVVPAREWEGRRGREVEIPSGAGSVFFAEQGVWDDEMNTEWSSIESILDVDFLSFFIFLPRQPNLLTPSVLK